MLAGDLVIKGYGDPKLTLENFWLLLRNLRARGVREIRGDLVLDRSYFAAGDFDPGALRRRAAAALQHRARRAARQLQGDHASVRARARARSVRSIAEPALPRCRS